MTWRSAATDLSFCGWSCPSSHNGCHLTNGFRAPNDQTRAFLWSFCLDGSSSPEIILLVPPSPSEQRAADPPYPGAAKNKLVGQLANSFGMSEMCRSRENS